MLINLSNHPSSLWSEAQIKAAHNQFGQITDLPFPSVDPYGDEKYIHDLVTKYLSKIQSLNRDSSGIAIHIMGEMTFTFAMVAELQKHGYTCLASTTERITVEQDGVKTSEFRFIKFREYEKL